MDNLKLFCLTLLLTITPAWAIEIKPEAASPGVKAEDVQAAAESPQAMPVLRGLIPVNAPSQSTVESFFQYPMNASGSQGQLHFSPTGPNQPQTKGKSLLHIFGLGLWHLLDEIGVPMFPLRDRDLDPSLSESQAIPGPESLTSLKLLERQNKPAAVKKTEKPSDASNLTTPPIPTTPWLPVEQHKLPQGELEGTIYEHAATENNQSQKK